jgi:hypothetical protein
MRPVFKVIVSRDGVSTETIGVKFGPKQSAVHVLVSCTQRVPCQKFMIQQTGDLSMWNGGYWNSVVCKAQRSNYTLNATNCAGALDMWQTYRGMPTTTLQWTAECQLRGKILPRNATDQAALLLNCQRHATIRAAILSLWHPAAHIWAGNVALDWNPAPAILHRESPCLQHHIFLPRDF